MTTTFFDTLTSQYIRELPIYKSGKPIEELERELGIRDALKIASNENPLGPSPRAIEAAHTAVLNAHMYPDSGAFHLRRALAERLGVTPDALLFGAGSNEIIHMLVHAFCRPGVDEVLTHECAFISYRLAAMSRDVRLVTTPITRDLACDVDALIDAMGPATKLIFLANPNNPTGSYVSRRAFERILEAAPETALLVVDEAYHEYAVAAADDYPSSREYANESRPQLITLRTFSKIHGLAGMRVGYATGDPRVIALLNRIRRPFNVNFVAQAAALAALDDEQHVRASHDVVVQGLAALSRVASRTGVKVYPSLGNFALLHVGRPAQDAYQSLLRLGVIVRPMEPWGLPEHVRVSVPRTDQLPRVEAALEQVLGV